VYLTYHIQLPKRVRLQIKSVDTMDGGKYLQEKERRSPSKTTKQVARRTTHQVYGIPMEGDVLLISTKLVSGLGSANIGHPNYKCLYVPIILNSVKVKYLKWDFYGFSCTFFNTVFICRPSNSTMSEDTCTKPKTAAT
jgi:hypothetical protein